MQRYAGLLAAVVLGSVISGPVSADQTDFTYPAADIEETPEGVTIIRALRYPTTRYYAADVYRRSICVAICGAVFMVVP